MNRVRTAAAIVLLVLTACDPAENVGQVSLSGPALTEFAVMHSVDRNRLGLPPLPSAASVRIHRTGGGAYDAMLHLAEGSNVSRTIAFRKEGDKFVWIHEQVIVRGPRQHTTVDGTFAEEITLTYETSGVAGGPKDQLNISYSGPDEALDMNDDLQPSDVQPLLSRWLPTPPASAPTTPPIP